MGWNVVDNGVQLRNDLVFTFFSLFRGEVEATLYLAFAFMAMTRYHIAGLDYASPGSECVVLLMEPLVAETLWLLPGLPATPSELRKDKSRLYWYGSWSLESLCR